MRALAGPSAALLALVACLGLTRLTVDGAAPWTLPPDAPLAQANARLNVATGGDDLLAVAVVDRRGGAHGLLDADGVAALERVQAMLSEAPGLHRVRSVLNAPLVDTRDGTITASTPFSPPPSDPATWQVARARLLTDPFAGQLISSDGRVASAVGWIDRGSRESAMVSAMNRELRRGQVPPDQAPQLRKLVSQARLAVALGEAEGPPDVAVARALEGSAVALERGWVASAEAQVADPAGVATAAVRAALTDLELPEGIHAELTGPRATEDALAAETPRAVRAALLAILAAAGLAGARRRRRPAEGLAAVVAGLLAFGGSLGLCGWMGVGLHPWLALLALLVASWTASLVVAGRGPALRSAPAVAAPAGLALVLGGGPGVAAVGLGSFALGLTLAAGFASPTDEPDPAPARWPVLPLLLVLAGLLATLVGRPLGLDPARMLAAGHAVGAATAVLGQELGTAPAAFLLYEGGSPRAIARPASLRALDSLQQAIEADAAVVKSASWADLIAQLHRAVAGPEGGRLPESEALVEQYLLLFGRPQETRALASAELDMAPILLRLSADGGTQLARLADRFPADDDAVTLVGQAVAMAVCARDRARLGGLGLLLGFILLCGGLGWGRRDRWSALALAGTAGAVAIAVAAWALGSIGLPAILAGGVAAGGSAATLLGVRGRVAAVPLLGLVVLIASPVALFSSFALGACSGLAASLGLSSLRRGP